MTYEMFLLLGGEMVLATVAVVIYMGGAFTIARRPWSWVALAGILVAAAVVMASPHAAASGRLVPGDSLAQFVRWAAMGFGALLVLAGSRNLRVPATPEYLGSLLLAVVGLMLSAGAGDLVLVFVGLETISIPTYIMLYLGPRDLASNEATTKYFFLSILASAILLYGLSFLYGLAGSTDLGVIHQRLAALAGGPSDGLAKIALVLILGGLSFKIAAVPFHFYAPDVYQGTTSANAGLLSVLPKAAGLAVLVRLLAAMMPVVQPYAWALLAAIAVLTMTVANVTALWQTNLRRLLAYSSVAHAGTMLIGLAVYAASPGIGVYWDGIAALLVYLIVYAVATIGAFAALACLGSPGRQVESVHELAGLAWTGGIGRPLLAWSIAVCMFSLAGIPPLAGFWGKLAVFASALGLARGPSGPWFIALAVIGVVNSAIAAAYYLRVVAVMFFRPSTAVAQRPHDGEPLVAALACAALALAIGIYPGPWLREADRASRRIAGRSEAAVESVDTATLDRASSEHALTLQARRP
jgi:NADH-quinone oxidoreductase subunit N